MSTFPGLYPDAWIEQIMATEDIRFLNAVGDMIDPEETPRERMRREIDVIFQIRGNVLRRELRKRSQDFLEWPGCLHATN